MEGVVQMIKMAKKCSIGHCLSVKVCEKWIFFSSALRKCALKKKLVECKANENPRFFYSIVTAAISH